MKDINSLDLELQQLTLARKVSPARKLVADLEKAVETLKNENPLIRLYDDAERPGGLVLLNQDIPVVVVPDLHARREFLYRVLNWKTPDGKTVLRGLFESTVQLLCLGDGFHSEKRGYYRWVRSFEEFQGKYKRHKNMDQEMNESFGLMEMIMILKSSFPGGFHFLKGNHENIRNEEGRGNHPFGKFVYEGEMVRQWVLRFQGEEFMNAYAEFEYLFPYMAVGWNFIASHAEPLEYYSPDEIINIEWFDHIKFGLTWTRNDQSEPGTVERFLKIYGEEFDRPLNCYLGGHRTISEKFRLRADGNFIQIHNPDKMQVYYSERNRQADPERDVINIEEEGVL